MATVDELRERLVKVEALASNEGASPAERATARRIAKGLRAELLERGAAAVAVAAPSVEELERRQRAHDARQAALRVELARLERELAALTRASLPEVVTVYEVGVEASNARRAWSGPGWRGPRR